MIGPITRAGMNCGPPGQPCPPPSIRYSVAGWQPGLVQVFRVTGRSPGAAGSSSIDGLAMLPVRGDPAARGPVAGDAVGRRPVGDDRLRARDDVLAGQLPVPDRAPLEYPAGDAAPGERAALVRRGRVAGAHDEDHAGAQLRHGHHPAARLKGRARDEEQAGHRQQAVPRHVLGVPRALRDPGEEDRPRPRRAESFHVAGELGEEPRVVELGLARRRPGRVPGALPAVGEDGGDPGGGAAPGRVR